MSPSLLLSAPVWAGVLLAVFAVRFLWVGAHGGGYESMMGDRIWQYWAVGTTLLLVHVVVTFSRTIELPVAELRAWSVATGTAAVPILLTTTFAVWLQLRRPRGLGQRAVARVYFHGAYAYPLLIMLMETLGAR